MTISAVGSFVTTSYPGASSAPTATVNPTAIGDILVVGTYSNNSTPPTVTSITHSGVSGSWHQLASEYDTTHVGADIELWYGVITATGAATLTVNYSGAGYPGIGVQQFHTTSGSWAQDGSGGVLYTGAGAMMSYPALTAAGAGELYVGFAVMDTLFYGMTAGSTTGYTYDNVDAVGGSGTYNQFCFNVAAASGSNQPTAGTTDSGGAGNGVQALGALISTGGAPAPNSGSGFLAMMRKRASGLFEPKPRELWRPGLVLA